MDVVPAISSAKRPRTKSVSAKSVAKESVSKESTTPKPKRKTLSAATRKPKVTDVAVTGAVEPEKVPLQDMRSMIETAAFYLAAERGFAPGQELDDWLEAERRIRALQAV